MNPEFRNPKSRNPKEGRNPKAEMGLWGRVEKVRQDGPLEPELSGFGLRISFGPRISNFGFQVKRSVPALLVLTAVLGGCMTKSKANARARAAYAAGQQQALNQMTEARRINIRFIGPVRQPEVLWQDGLTLAQAIAAAGYTDARDPNVILIIRQRERVPVSPRDLLAGKDFPLEPGDTIELRP